VLPPEPDIHITHREVHIGFAKIKLILLVPAHRIGIEAGIDRKDRVGVSSPGYLPLEAGALPWADSSARDRAIDQCSRSA
jgi:hypothetical protein